MILKESQQTLERAQVTVREAKQGRSQDRRADKSEENESRGARIFDSRVVRPLLCQMLPHFTENVTKGAEFVGEQSFFCGLIQR